MQRAWRNRCTYMYMSTRLSSMSHTYGPTYTDCMYTNDCVCDLGAVTGHWVLSTSHVLHYNQCACNAHDVTGVHTCTCQRVYQACHTHMDLPILTACKPMTVCVTWVQSWVTEYSQQGIRYTITSVHATRMMLPVCIHVHFNTSLKHVTRILTYLYWLHLH